MNVQIIQTELTQFQANELDIFVNSHTNGNIFQSALAYSHYIDLKYFEPCLLIVRKSDVIIGSLLAVFIKEKNKITGYFSRRCMIWGGPLVNDNKTLFDLLSELNKIAKQKSVFTEFRNLFDWSESQKKVFLKCGFQFEERLDLIVNIDNFESVKKGFSESRRRQLKKAFETGVKIREASSLNDIEVYYEILERLYRFKVKKPLPQIDYFKAFYEKMILKGDGVCLLVDFEDKIIGGMLCHITKGKTIYETYVCGLDKEFKNCHPSVVATYAAMEYASINNIPQFDFMGLGIPNIPYGVREFKLRFGGTEVNFGRFNRVNNRFLYLVSKVGFYFWSKCKAVRI